MKRERRKRWGKGRSVENSDLGGRELREEKMEKKSEAARLRSEDDVPN
jgi:hypothetical protein